METAEHMAQGMYTGAADFGKIMAVIGGACMIIVGGVIMYIGIQSKMNPGDPSFQPNPNDPNSKPNPNVMIAVGVLLILFASVYLWLTFRYKVFAAVSGASEISRMIF